MDKSDRVDLVYSASYDSTTKVISAVVCAIPVAVAAIGHSSLAGALGALLIGLCYAYSPRGYAIEERSIRVARLIGSARVSLGGVREIRRVTADDLRGCIRLFGNGGLFGYYGLFRTNRLGKCTWYCTRRDDLVAVITGAGTSVFSPDDVEGFLATVQGTAGAPVKVAAPAATQPDRGRNWFLMLIAPALAAAATAFGAWVVRYAPGPPKYTLTSETLTIHDRFYPVTLSAGAVDVAKIRVVDFGVDANWRPTERTNGFANGHYRSGWFRVANGQKVRMYRAEGRRVVLLPPKGDGAAVLLEARDPEEFVREVQRKWL